MLQLIIWLMAFYLVIKGIEVLQIGLASNRQSRDVLIVIGVLTLISCVIVAIAAFVLTSSPSPDRTAMSDLTNVTPHEPVQTLSKEAQAVSEAEVDAHNKGWEWAKQHKVTVVKMCAELSDAQVRVGCERYADAFGKKP